MATATPFSLKELEDDPRLFLYTSLTSGSSHIVTATSRMETILKANRIPFQAIDIATDEKARRLWQRRAGAQRKLPGLVKQGFVIGDLNEVEEWNEFGELKEKIGPVKAAAPVGGQLGVNLLPPPESLLGGPIATASSATMPSAERAVEKGAAGFDRSQAIRLPAAEEMAARHKEMAEAKARGVEGKKEGGSAEKEETAPPAAVPETDESKEEETAPEKAKHEEDLEEKASKPTQTDSTPSTTTTEKIEAPAAESEKVEAPAEENEKAEPKKTEPVKKEPSQAAETEAATKGIADLKVDQEEKTQEQDPKDASNAATSVED